MLRTNSWLVLISIIVFSCTSSSTTEPNDNENQVINNILVDSLATSETVALFKNLQELSQSKLLFDTRKLQLTELAGKLTSGTGRM